MLSGSLVAIVTPMQPGGALDFPALARLIDFHTGNGTSGIVIVGTTGESPTVNVDEHCQLIKAAIDHAAGRIPVIAGTGGNSTAEAIELTRFAKGAGAAACLSVVPYYNKPTQEGMYRHFRTIAEAVDLPVILYNVPSRTARNMEAATTLRLAEIPNIVAIKEASGNFEQIGAILAGCPASFLVYSGDDALTLPMMAMGAHGIISVASHLAGGLIRQMVEAFVAGRTAEAADLHRRLTPLFKACFATTNPIPVKAGLNLIGVPVGAVRLPLVPASDAVINGIREALAGLREGVGKP